MLLPVIFLANPTSEGNSNHPTVRDAIMKIRFLTLSPQQFAEGPGKSTLLSESEKFAILMNICTPNAAVPMPDGFSSSTTPRRRKKSNVDPFNLVNNISFYFCQYHILDGVSLSTFIFWGIF